MKLLSLIRTVLLAVGLPIVLPAWASTTYTYTDSGSNGGTYSGSFSVASTLADGSYSFLSSANQPAGFTQTFFTTSFVDGRGVTRTPSLSLFDITISNGAVADWDIRASSLFTSVTYSSCARTSCKTYHDNSSIIYHATNITYLPGAGGAYQLPITGGDYATYYRAGFAYQESLTGFYSGPGVWSMASPMAPVPEPESSALLLVGLGVVVFAARRRGLSKYPAGTPLLAA